MQINDKFKPPALFGIGGGGCNLVRCIAGFPNNGFELFAVNTDRKNLLKSPTPNRILLGESICKGMSCGGLPVIGREAALESERVLRQALKGQKMVVVVAGLGGGCGCGAAPEVVRMAQQEGVPDVFAVAATPFPFEGPVRLGNAKDGLVHLRLETGLIFEVAGYQSRRIKRDFFQEFRRVDLKLWGVVSALRDLFATEHAVDLNRAGLKRVLASRRGVRLGYGEAVGSVRVRPAWMKAVRPLVEGIPMGAARELWLHLTARRGGTLSEMNEAVVLAKAVRPEGAELHVSCAKDPNAGECLRMTVLATGA